MGNIIKKIQAGTITYDIEPAQSAAIEVVNKAPTLAWDTTSIVATIDGTDITVKMPLETKYIAASTTTAGLMSAADKTKLDGIATGANKVTKANATGNTTTVASNSHIHSVTASGSVSLTHTSTNSGNGGTGNTGAPSGTTATATVVTGSYTNGVLTLSTTTVASNSHVHAGPSHSHTYDKSTSASFSGTAVNTAGPSGTTATTTVPTSGHTHGLA